MKLTWPLKDPSDVVFAAMFEPLKEREVELVIGGRPEKATFVQGHMNAFGQLGFTLRAADGSERFVVYSNVWSLHVL